MPIPKKNTRASQKLKVTALNTAIAAVPDTIALTDGAKIKAALTAVSAALLAIANGPDH